MNSKDIGNIGEHIAIVELLKLDIEVSRPLGDNSRYDLIIDINSILYTCQIKSTDSASSDCAKFFLQSSQAHRGAGKLHYNVDCLILVDIQNNKVFCMSGRENRTAINIRYVKPSSMNQNGINYAEDFLLSKERLIKIL